VAIEAPKVVVVQGVVLDSQEIIREEIMLDKTLDLNNLDQMALQQLEALLFLNKTRLILQKVHPLIL